MESIAKFERVLEILREDNAKLSRTLLVAAADWIIQMDLGRKNVRQYGAHVLHPKSGTPIENPWLGTIEKAEKNLLGAAMIRIRKDRAVQFLERVI